MHNDSSATSKFDAEFDIPDLDTRLAVMRVLAEQMRPMSGADAL
jgi:hypothetical protein